MSGPLLTARAVAEHLGVSSETVLRWARRGDLPVIRLPGGAVRFREDEIEVVACISCAAGGYCAHQPKRPRRAR